MCLPEKLHMSLYADEGFSSNMLIELSVRMYGGGLTKTLRLARLQDNSETQVQTLSHTPIMPKTPKTVPRAI